MTNATSDGAHGDAREIAQDFMRRWEQAWNDHGAQAAARLYAPDAILVGYVTALGRDEIANLLQGIIQQGFTSVQITVTEARRIGDVVLAANEYVATGSGQSAGKTLSAKSSHVLVYLDGEWLSAMHTAT
jgi:uncharacterized protein (TIGR02246 family)